MYVSNDKVNGTKIIALIFFVLWHRLIPGTEIDELEKLVFSPIDLHLNCEKKKIPKKATIWAVRIPNS